MASKVNPLKYLKALLTQGGANAFVQGSITTGLSGETRLAYRVRHMLLQTPDVVAGASFDWDISFTRKSVAAVPAISDKSTIWKMRANSGFTTSGFLMREAIMERFFDEDEFIIVEDPLYWQYDSTGFGAAGTIHVALGYEEAPIADDDRLNLLVGALS